MAPARPVAFHHELAPVGVEVRFYSDWRNRPLLDVPARIAAVHTNAASREGSVDSASAWSERNRLDDGVDYTIAHYQVDRQERARKMLPTNRRGIANSTVLPGTSQWAGLTQAQRLEVNRHPVNVSKFSIAIETADTGTLHDPQISAFTDFQIATIAEILAFEHLVPGNQIPLETPKDWFGSGVGTHTDPFPYPLWTTVRGKTCPGAKKKAQLPEILAEARLIVAAWTAPKPPPEPAPKPPASPEPPLPEEDDMARKNWIACKLDNGSFWLGDGDSCRWASSKLIAAHVAAGPVVDAGTGRRINGTGDLTVVTAGVRDWLVGAVDGSKPTTAPAGG